MRKVICHPCHRVPFSAFGWTHRAVVCAKNVGLGRGGKPVCAVRSFLFNRTVNSAYSEQLCVQFLFCTCTNLFCTGKNLCRNVKILYQIILYKDCASNLFCTVYNTILCTVQKTFVFQISQFSTKWDLFCTCVLNTIVCRLSFDLLPKVINYD